MILPRQVYQTKPTRYCERLVLCMHGVLDIGYSFEITSDSFVCLGMIQVVIVLRPSDLIPKIELPNLEVPDVGAVFAAGFPM